MEIFLPIAVAALAIVISVTDGYQIDLARYRNTAFAQIGGVRFGHFFLWLIATGRSLLQHPWEMLLISKASWDR